MNNSDSPVSLPEDQCVLAQNVEFVVSPLGERRRGCASVTLPSNISDKDRVSFLFRHTPSSDQTAAELFAMGFTGTTTSYRFERKTTAWSQISVADTVNLAGFAPYQWQAASHNGKAVVCMDTDVDRLHVWDGTSFRRTGLAEPAAPTGADDGGAGTFSGVRYYRVRYTVQSGGTTILRSEPSDSLTFTPNGNDTGITVTKPASISESETHWELEASLDNATFYRIATTAVATTTFTDTAAYTTGYAANPLSADVGDYTLIPSARYIVADEDRLVWGGSWETAAYNSRVGWTPVGKSDGVGNDERMESDTDPVLDLDKTEGGALSGLASPVLGSIWVFKFSHIYKLVRTGQRTRAYEPICVTKKRGALHGSVVEGVDAMGRSCVYFLDPAVGPCQIGGPNGSQRCGADIWATWQSLNIDATKVVCTSVFYPDTRQVHWWIATGVSNVPDVHVVLQTDAMEQTRDGLRKGYALWTGPSAGALCACLFSDNVNDGAARSLTLRPVIGLEATGAAAVLRMDTGTDDNGTAYSARVLTKHYAPGNHIDQFEMKSAALIGKAVTGATLNVKLNKNFGEETKSDLDTLTFTPATSETHQTKILDDLMMAELRQIQLEFVDPASPGSGRWELDLMVLKDDRGQRA